jgi:cytochrome c peroxidase
VILKQTADHIVNPDTDSSQGWKTDPTATLDCGSPHVREQAAIQSDMSVLGRFLVTKKEPDTASFKTPDLRNVLMTARISTTARKQRCGM